MRRLLVGLVLFLLAGGVQAAPPTEAQKTQFYKICMDIAQNQTLCSCKAEATDKLIDTSFMAVVIASMGGKTLDPKYAVRYNDYVARSNQICKPNY